jgi:hypothetical protein
VETLEGMEIYFFIRVILFIFIISSLVISVLMIGPLKWKQLVNGLTIGLFLFLALVVSGINVMIMGYLGDGIYRGGDAIISYMFITLFILCVLNLILYVNSLKQRSSKGV